MRPGGLEPPTSWSVARRSIQLSYGRKNTAERPWVRHPIVQPRLPLGRSFECRPRRARRRDRDVLYRTSQGAPTAAQRRYVPKILSRDAHDRTRTCTPFPALVPQTSLSTNSSTWATSYQRSDPGEGGPTLPVFFLGSARGGTRTLTGLPPQDPESCASTNSATRALIHHMEPGGIEPPTS